MSNKNEIDPVLANFAGTVRNDMMNLDSMNMGGFGKQNRITMPPQNMPPKNMGLSPFLENPSANYAGSEVVGMEVPNPDFIPIPEDMRERILAISREENLNVEHKKQSTPPQAQTRIPTQTINTIPDGFDFDLFQFAILKDLSCNIQNVLVQLEACKNNLEKNKSIIDVALSKSPMSKKK